MTAGYPRGRLRAYQERPRTTVFWQAVKVSIEPILATAPFGPTIIDCIEQLVQKIIDIESARGEIARAEGSALHPKAQPLQDLLDHMIYRMAGLTDAEAVAVEQRLAKML